MKFATKSVSYISPH